MQTENLKLLADAISQQEGFGIPGARPTRNHNCGDLRNWPGYPVDDGGFAIFPDDATGRAKLEMDLRNHAASWPDQSLFQFIAGDGDKWPGYAPASDANDSAGYALALAQALGVQTSTTFQEL